MKSQAVHKGQPPTTDKLLISRKEAAERLSLCERSVDYLIADGRLKCRRIGSRVYIHVKVLEAFAESDHTESISTKA